MTDYNYNYIDEEGKVVKIESLSEEEALLEMSLSGFRLERQ